MDHEEFDALLGRMMSELAPFLAPEAASAPTSDSRLNEHAAARILARVTARIAASETGEPEGSDLALFFKASRRAAKSEKAVAAQAKVAGGQASGVDVASAPAVAARGQRRGKRLDFEQLEPRNPLSTLGAFGADSFAAYHPPAELLHATAPFVSCELVGACAGGAIAVLW